MNLDCFFITVVSKVSSNDSPESSAALTVHRMLEQPLIAQYEAGILITSLFESVFQITRSYFLLLILTKGY